VLFKVVIPARYASTRLPGKALRPIAGKPMLQWVYELCCAAQADEVCIATDDERIAEHARSFDSPARARVLMTSGAHASGTDRVAEVARMMGWGERQIVVNVQGDEPLLPPPLIRQVATLLERYPQADIATLATPVESLADFLSPNVVKVVSDHEQRVLYFSRAPIPWTRDAEPGASASPAPWRRGRRHVGLYAYRAGALQRLAALPVSPLEVAEKLEQLRALEAGFEIRVADGEVPPGPDVNTEADLERVAALILASRLAVPAVSRGT
jgi:3-deoxy-manno-octulosonate cytidylyltransferase (CMP-KDO synthetase)